MIDFVLKIMMLHAITKNDGYQEFENNDGCSMSSETDRETNTPSTVRGVFLPWIRHHGPFQHTQLPHPRRTYRKHRVRYFAMVRTRSGLTTDPVITCLAIGAAAACPASPLEPKYIKVRKCNNCRLRSIFERPYLYSPADPWKTQFKCCDIPDHAGISPIA